jgi:uncharacterized protein YjiK
MSRPPGTGTIVLALAAVFAPGLRGWTQTVGHALASYSIEADEAVQFDLPRSLREVSGLATTADGRIFAHDDERARVHELDPASGESLKRIDAGDGGIRGDFEGLAIVDERFFLVDSDARLFEFREGDDREDVPYEEFDTGLGRRCEVEGLAYDALSDALLLACKNTRGSDLRGHLVVFAVRLADMRVESEPRFKVPYSSLEDVDARGRLHPSGIEVHPERGSVVVVAAQEEGLVEISREGRFVAALELPGRLHRQPEGITFADAALLLADEGGRGRGTLTRYPSTASKAGPHD